MVETEKAWALVCPFRGPNATCAGKACMAWRSLNDEVQYRVLLKGNAPKEYTTITYWMDRAEADYLTNTGYYELLDPPRQPSGYCALVPVSEPA